ncbi:riboflavin kinase [Patescibacteria group bacterium]|nr:riboflavin kinase [Patescibacteria group bacterium]
MSTNIITGKVIHGDGYGRKIGFPTVNLEIEEQLLPKEGIYAGNGLVENKKYRAGIIIGPNRKIEAHLLGYNENAYGKMVKLEIEKFLREYRKFETEEELINQIKKDIALC